MTLSVDLKSGRISYNGEEIGFIKFKIIGQDVEIMDMWLTKRYRGMGFGRQVVETLESEFRKIGVRQVELFRVQPSGLAFAQAMGYTIVRDFSIYKHMMKTL